MGAAKKKERTPTPADVEADKRKELDDLLYEHSVIADRMDALEEMKSARRNRILLLMRDLGSTKFEGEAGQAAFTTRRSFTVRSAEKLAELMTPLQLAALASITADVYDAAKAEKVAIDDAVTVGQSESLTVSRARTKAETDRRKQHIAESKRQAEQRIAELREQFIKK